ncbi:hypothetical protein PV328_011729 [Microctonus aethiopoides]|uniref:Uncharacterized protein n=1 Tax=Microctonus aethiopoides TaxID=144406 RepID=A0AA39C4E8_9HYME|nr:hypothetical protein PV328_011729 [Microctonus aethiopoides]
MQREAERRRRLQNAEIITELFTSSHIEFTELVHEPLIDEISANSQNVAALENIQHLFVEVSQQNERGQSSANGTEITNNYNLKKPSALGNSINTITNVQNVDALNICSTCKSALDKNKIANFSVYNGFPKYIQKSHSIYRK